MVVASDDLMPLFTVDEAAFGDEAWSPQHEAHDDEPQALKEYAEGTNEADYEAFGHGDSHEGC